MALLVVIGVLSIFLADGGVSCGSKRFISNSKDVYNGMFTVSQDANAQRMVRRDTSRFERDEVGWTNINEEVDMAIEKIWPLISSGSYSTLALPNMTETISVRTLFITNSAGLRLSNGHLYNIQGIQRHGDAFMTYSDKSFQFRSDILIRSLQFAYDFAVDIFVIGVSGSLDGILQDVLVSGDFSVSAEDATISLNAFKIKSFGDIAIRLKEYPIILLRPITNLFKDRITTTMSDAVKTQLQGLIAEVNNEDRLELKKFLNNTLAGLTG